MENSSFEEDRPNLLQAAGGSKVLIYAAVAIIIAVWLTAEVAPWVSLWDYMTSYWDAVELIDCMGVKPEEFMPGFMCAMWAMRVAAIGAVATALFAVRSKYSMFFLAGRITAISAAVAECIFIAGVIGYDGYKSVDILVAMIIGLAIAVVALVRALVHLRHAMRE